jgi:phospholipase D1/2
VNLPSVSKRAYKERSIANSWEEIWEAGPYYDRISELLETSRHYAVFAGWQIDSRLPLRSFSNGTSNPVVSTPVETLREKVIRLCEEKPNFQVYFLLWDHAYLYMLERELWQGRIWDQIHARVHFVFDNRHPFGASHHEKVSIFDGKTALCGGIDLCDERWDTPQHLYFDPRRSLDWRREHHGPYHDLAVQVTGPVCREIQKHLERRWNALSSIPFPNLADFKYQPKDATAHQVYVSRTIAQIDHAPLQNTVIREVEFLFRDLIDAAQERIILEGQYYWSQAVNDMLISKIHQMKGKKFEVILILAELQNTKSLTRYMMAYELSLLRKLQLAAQYAGIQLTMGSPYVFSPDTELGLPPKSIYIHSKILIIDDRFLAIGSANFATRALRVDTEIHLTLEAKTNVERNHISRVAHQVLDHWKIPARKLGPDVGLRYFQPLVEMNHLKKGLERLKGFSCQYFYDPNVSWFYRFKFRKQNAYQWSVLFWLIGASMTVFWMSRSFPSDLWAWSYGALLSSVWFLRISFVLLTVLASVHLGLDDAIRISVPALWIASLIGYWSVRTFPTFSSVYFKERQSSSHKRPLGLRDFSTLITWIANPRVSVRSKIAYQGLYFVPVPWFFLGTLLILPASLYVCLKFLQELSERIQLASYPGFQLITLMTEIIRRNAGPILIATAVVSIGHTVIRLWKNTD